MTKSAPKKIARAGLFGLLGGAVMAFASASGTQIHDLIAGIFITVVFGIIGCLFGVIYAMLTSQKSKEARAQKRDEPPREPNRKAVTFTVIGGSVMFVSQLIGLQKMSGPDANPAIMIGLMVGTAIGTCLGVYFIRISSARAKRKFRERQQQGFG